MANGKREDYVLFNLTHENISVLIPIDPSWLPEGFDGLAQHKARRLCRGGFKPLLFKPQVSMDAVEMTGFSREHLESCEELQSFIAKGYLRELCDIEASSPELVSLDVVEKDLEEFVEVTSGELEKALENIEEDLESEIEKRIVEESVEEITKIDKETLLSQEEKSALDEVIRVAKEQLDKEVESRIEEEIGAIDLPKGTLIEDEIEEELFEEKVEVEKPKKKTTKKAKKPGKPGRPKNPPKRGRPKKVNKPGRPRKK